ncbi:MAG: T4 RnlA family RNA ligase [Candidatus Ratteibacteria bacterium]|nr:T4 RnlA family RNA ligase [Candidatus Ratteibacteria bacterium]
MKNTININELNARIASGRIKATRHPDLDLTIYNYTKRTQYDSLWDEYTKMCRGLILDSDGEIVARPFKKFFNLNEVPETKIENLPNRKRLGYPTFSEKYDGVLGILYPEKKLSAISTRGAFKSEYAVWATDWIRKKGFSMDDFWEGYTYCFEIVYPGSKIVIDYGERSELILLAVLNNNGKDELDYIREAQQLGFSYAEEFPFTEIDDAINWLKDFKGDEREGLVMKYDTGLRVKIKSDDYRRIHKILTGLSARDIWESLKAGQSLDLIIAIAPDEMYDSIRSCEKDLTTAKDALMTKAQGVAQEASSLTTRREQAEYILNHAKPISGAVFALIDGDGKKATQLIWQALKPDFELFKSSEF